MTTPLVTDLVPADMPDADSPLARRSAGVMPEPALPVVVSPVAPEIDVWALASRLARGHERVVMRATVAEIRALADAVLELTGGLVAARAVDRSAPYEIDEARPDGALPQPGQRWRTPRDVVDQLIGWEEPK